MPELTQALLENALANAIGTVAGGLVLSVLFFLLREKFFALPRLSGSWVYLSTVRNTSYRPYDDMKVYYHALLSCQGDKIIGEGEKYFELTHDHRWNYDGANRVRVRISGQVDKRIFGNDVVTLVIHEEGHERSSTTYHDLRCVTERGTVVLDGSFRSTVASAHGDALWTPEAAGYPALPIYATPMARLRRRILLLVASPFFRVEWQRIRPLAVHAYREFIRFESRIRSTSLVSLLIAAEDRRHLAHNGIDARGTARAIWRMLTRHTLEGASTIDQQFVRALHGDFRKSLFRKAKDVVLAVRLQELIPKRHIAGSYLLVAYFGPDLVGVIFTARRLGIDLSTCSDIELAKLIARIKYPATAVPSARGEALLDMRSTWMLKQAALPSSAVMSRN